eukprot:Lankesteria_metandrocarpae@DN4465_c0_g1_i3.p1
MRACFCSFTKFNKLSLLPTHALPAWLLVYTSEASPDKLTSMQLTDLPNTAHYMDGNTQIVTYYLVYVVRAVFTETSARKAEYMSCSISEASCDESVVDRDPQFVSYRESGEQIKSRPLVSSNSDRSIWPTDSLRRDGSLEDVIAFQSDRETDASIHLTCAIMSSDETFYTYGIMAANTWAKYCDDWVIFTDTVMQSADPTGPGEAWATRTQIYSKNSSAERNFPIGALTKMQKGDQPHTNSWFLVVGDKSYMMVDNAKALLKTKEYTKVCLGVEDRYIRDKLEDQFPVFVHSTILQRVHAEMKSFDGPLWTIAQLCKAAAIPTIPASVIVDDKRKALFNVLEEDYFKTENFHWIDKLKFLRDLEKSLPTSTPVSLCVRNHYMTAYFYHYLLYVLNLSQPTQ